MVVLLDLTVADELVALPEDAVVVVTEGLVAAVVVVTCDVAGAVVVVVLDGAEVPRSASAACTCCWAACT